MSEVTLSVSIPSDNDGYVTVQCPFCDGRFKLTAKDFERKDLIYLFCPYCGLQEEGNQFLSDEVIEQIQIVATNYLKTIVNQFQKDLKRSFKKSKFLSFKAGKKLKEDPENTLFESEEMDLSHCPYCDFGVKVQPIAHEIGICCPYCGVR